MITINKMHIVHTYFSIFPEQIEIMRVVQKLKCHESQTKNVIKINLNVIFKYNKMKLIKTRISFFFDGIRKLKQSEHVVKLTRKCFFHLYIAKTCILSRNYDLGKYK